MVASCLLLASCLDRLPRPDMWDLPGLNAPSTDGADDHAVEAAPVMSAPVAERRPATVVEGAGKRTSRSKIPPPTASISEAHTNPAGDVTFSFVEADVRQVVKAVLGDILGRRWVVSPKVQGNVSVQTGQPVSREAAFSTLEAVLRLHGFAMVEDGGIVKVVLYDEAPRVAGTARLFSENADRPPGYGIEIMPLIYVSAGEMKKMLEPMAPTGAMMQADDARNILIFSGTREELRATREMIDIFDVDWLRGMSFALLPLASSDAKSVTTEMAGIFGETAQGPLKNLMRFVPVERLNAVLVIATNPDYLSQARRWVETFDKAGEQVGQGRRLYVYQVQNGRASDMAAVLDALFGSRPSAGLSSVQVPIGQTPNGAGGKGAQSVLPGAFSPPPSDRTLDRGNQPAALGDPVASMVPIFQNGARIVADSANNSLVVLATPEEEKTIEQALRRLDVVPLQVLVDATIAEVTLNDELRYGLQWFFSKGDASATFSNLATGAVASAFPGFSFALQGTNARVILNALSDITTINVVSAPTLMVLSNQSAVLQVGDQVPVAVQQERSTVDPNAPIVNTIQFRDTGVILRITPRVNAGGLIYLDVEQEVSDVAVTTSSSIDSPTIRQRRIGSTVAVQSGETVALGGLIRDTRSKGKTGIPVLGDIPVLGNLFSTTDDSVARTELLVLLQPRIVRTRDEARSVTAELRRRLKGIAPLSQHPTP